MNWKIILSLLVLCLGLGVFLFLGRDTGTTLRRNREQTNPLMSFNVDQVRQFVISSPDTNYVFRRRGKEWVMVSPIVTLADSMQVNQLLRVLNLINVLQSISVDSIDLVQARLDRPVAIYKVFLDNGDSSQVAFGEQTPKEEDFYVRRNQENRVLLVTNVVESVLNVDSFILRSKQLSSVSPFEASFIRYRRAGAEDLLLELAPETGRWTMIRGDQRELADKRKILWILDCLYQDWVRVYLPPDADKGKLAVLSAPLRQLTIADRQGDTVRIALGGPADPPYLRWAVSSIYPENLLLVDSSLVSLVDSLSADKIRDKHLLDFDRFAVNRIELFSSMDSIVLVAENDTLWRMTRPENVPCILWQVDALLTHLDTMKALEIVPASGRHGFEHPQLSLTLSSSDKVLARILVGDYTQDQLYVRDGVRGIDFLVPASELRNLAYTVGDLADLTVRHVVR